MNEKLYKKVSMLDWRPAHVAEIGVYYPETSNILGFIEDSCRTDLVEADPECVDRIRERFKGYDHVRIHPYAVFDTRGEIELYRVGASTFARSLENSPALANDGYEPDEQHVFRVEARLFSDIDDGTIDLISIDIEGCEWYVLKHMKSRPSVVSIEMGKSGKPYSNPFRQEIKDWLKTNGYVQWYVDGSDTIYIIDRLKPKSWFSF